MLRNNQYAFSGSATSFVGRSLPEQWVAQQSSRSKQSSALTDARNKAFSDELLPLGERAGGAAQPAKGGGLTHEWAFAAGTPDETL